MVQYSNPALDSTFGALADPTRRAILARLAKGEASVTQLAAPHDMSLVAVLKHVRVLQDAGLCRMHKEGRVRRCRLQVKPLRTAAEWIRFYRQFWQDQFDALEDFLREDKEESPHGNSIVRHVRRNSPPPADLCRAHRKSLPGVDRSQKNDAMVRARRAHAAGENHSRRRPGRRNILG